MRPCDGFVTCKSCVIGEGGNCPKHTQNPLHPVLKGNQHFQQLFRFRQECQVLTRWLSRLLNGPEWHLWKHLRIEVGKSYKLVLVLSDDITLDWRKITLTDFGTLSSNTLLLIPAGNYSDRWIQFVNGDGQELGIWRAVVRGIDWMRWCEGGTIFPR